MVDAIVPGRILVAFVAELNVPNRIVVAYVAEFPVCFRSDITMRIRQ